MLTNDLSNFLFNVVANFLEFIGCISLDIIHKISTIFIAIFNTFFAIKIFYFKNRKDDVDKEKDRRIQLLKTLVLDHYLKHFYELFSKIQKELTLFKLNSQSESTKNKQIEKIDNLFIDLRRQFYDLLLAVDEDLYESVKDKADELQIELTISIKDPEIDLSDSTIYAEKIDEKIASTKAEIIKKLFHYRG